ncbi:MAG: MFS transporter [Chloroflexota bacterium]|nr:MAG: MFS transporter [Chloroflexota bacterium]
MARIAFARGPRWSRFALGADLAVFHLGMAFASQQTLVPAFAERLGAPNIVIGLIPALMAVGWMLPSIFAANYTQGLSRKLPFLLRWTILERISYPILGFAAIFLAVQAPTLTLVLLIALLVLMTVIGGALMPAWLDLIGKAVETTLRGRFFALSNGAGSLLGLIGAAAVGVILERYPYPLGYGICFLAGSVCLVVSFMFLASVSEEPSAETPRRDPLGVYLRRLPDLIRSDANLRRFLVARALYVAGSMASGFFTVYALKNLGAGDAVVGIFTTVMLASKLAGTLAAGWVADRRGHVIVLVFGSVASGLAAIVALIATDVTLMYGAIALSGVNLASTDVSALAVGLELGPESERPTYIAINNSWVAPFALISPLIGGALADSFGYHSLFLVAAVISAIAVVAFLVFVEDPRHVAARRAVR